MFTQARKEEAQWILTNRWGHELRLPAIAPGAGGAVQIGTLGTRFEAPKSAPRTSLVADMLRAMRRPLILIDTRRTGVGGMGAWGPLEFATLIPERMGDDALYDFIHLPVLAPAPSLLAAERRGEVAGWRAYRERYAAGLGPGRVALARAWVEAASLRGGLAVFVCAEAWCADFEALDAQDQHAAYCHRFSLAGRVAAALQADHPGVVVERVDLDAHAFAMHRAAGGAYGPSMTPL